MMRFDVIVMGLGAMGSAVVAHLAGLGRRVLGVDRFSPPHKHGSSHGETRVIREAYFEDPVYVPLVQRAYQLWEKLEADSGVGLFCQTGGLMIGRPEGAIVSGAGRSAEAHGLCYEALTAADVRRRFPQFQPGDGMAAIWEPRAGVLFPERCVEAHLKQAAARGAELVFDTAAEWEADGQGVAFWGNGGRHSAGQLVLCCGAWLPGLLGGMRLPLEVERQVMFWFDPLDAAAFRPDRTPIHIWEWEAGKYFYGLPDMGRGVKVARHHAGEITTAAKIRREVDAAETESMRELVRRFLPKAEGALREAAVCMYTNLPDENFLIDRHPLHPQVLVVSACSGHGFKFSSVIGEIAARDVCGMPSEFNLERFRNREFSGNSV